MKTRSWIAVCARSPSKTTWGSRKSLNKWRFLSAQQKEGLQKTLEAYFHAPVVLQLKTKPDLIGGLVIRSGDLLIDTSVQHDLVRLREKLLKQKILGEAFYEN